MNYLTAFLYLFVTPSDAWVNDNLSVKAGIGVKRREKSLTQRYNPQIKMSLILNC